MSAAPTLEPTPAARCRQHRRARPYLPIGQAREGAHGRVGLVLSFRAGDVAVLDAASAKLGRTASATVRTALDLLAVDLAAGARPRPEPRRGGRRPPLARLTMAAMRAGLPGYATPSFRMSAGDARQLDQLTALLACDRTTAVRLALRRIVTAADQLAALRPDARQVAA